MTTRRGFLRRALLLGTSLIALAVEAAQAQLQINQLVGFGAGQTGFTDFVLDGSIATGSSSLVYTVQKTIPAGSIAIGIAGGTNGYSSFVDSKGNSWLFNQTGSDPDGDWCAVGFGVITSALNPGDTITVNSGGGSRRGIFGYIPAPLTGTSGDQDGLNNGQGTNSSPSSGSSGTLAQAKELMVGAVSMTSSAAVAGEAANFNTVGAISSGTKNLSLAVRTTAATTAVTYTPTLSASVHWVATIMTFKLA
jgi:hypothetical protein